MYNKNPYESTSTFIRNLYSLGYSSMRISFYKVNLSLLFQPFEGKNPRTGLSIYNKRGIMTTVTYEGAAALWKSCYDIIHGSVETLTLVIPCAAGASLTLEKKAPGEIFITINKDNQLIPFKFASQTIKVKENGVETVKIVETGLSVFMKVIDGYLEGTNADGHLNKLGDDFEQYQEAN